MISTGGGSLEEGVGDLGGEREEEEEETCGGEEG